VKATVALSDRVLAALPVQVSLAQAAPAVKYNHRHWSDGEVYFFFNESTSDAVDNSVTLSTGPAAAETVTAQVWDGHTGTIQPITPTGHTADTITVPLRLAAQSSEIVVIGPGGR
jgi:hypothetical protein